MKKRFLSLALALVLGLGLVPIAAGAADSDFVIENGVLTKYVGADVDVVIPDTVTSIARYAFEELDIQRLTIPDTVSALDFAVVSNCNSLQDVVIPASVVQIHSCAFEYHHEGMAGARAIPGLTIHGAAGSFAEAWVNTAKVGIDKLCDSLFHYTFVADQKWEVAPEAAKHSFVVEDGVLKHYFGPGGDVVVPDGVTKLGTSVLNNLNLNSLVLPAGIQEVSISNPYVKEITVGDGAEKVSLECDALESVVLPDSVTRLSITSNALRELTIPAGVDMWPTLECPKLRKITYPADNYVFKGISQADFFAKAKQTPFLDEVVNCPNEFAEKQATANKVIRDKWTNPQSTIVAQSDRIVNLSNEIAAGFTTDYDKAKAISQWVVANIKYDDDFYYAGLKNYSDVPFDPEEVLDKGQAVCAGISRLTQALLVAQGIPCLYVHGIATEPHAWNLALIDGDYLWIDNTWGMKYFGLGTYAFSEKHEAISAAAFDSASGAGTIISVQDDDSENSDWTIVGPTTVSLRENLIDASYHTAFVDKNGVLWTWGRNGFGQLGNDTTDRSSTPVKALENVATVSCGYNHTAAILRDGSLYVWGNNGCGQVGDGTTTPRTTPVKVLDNVAAVSCGYTHTAAIRTDGTLWVWGSNSFGELCDGSNSESLLPKKVLDSVKSVACGRWLTVVVNEDGTVWAWGLNYGESDGKKVGLNNVVSVSCGADHIAALDANGTLWTWGNNKYGQLGNGSGSGTSNLTPMQVLNNVASVSCGQTHTAAVTMDGSLYLWGENANGQLGDGSTNGISVPTKLMDHVAAVACGFADTFAIKTDGTLWAWGNNDDGRLSFNTEEVVKQLTPRQVLALESGTPVVPTSPTAYQSTQSVLVDGEAVTFQCYALKDANGNLTNYIKLRDLADILNGSSAQFQVGWDGSVTITTKTAYTSNGSEGSTPFSGDRTYQENTTATKVNGQAAELDAFVLNDDTGGGYTYYQLRDLGQTIGFNVGWSADKGIFVETDKPYDPAD